MADMYAVSKETLDDIANAIMLKRDSAAPISVKDMPLQIGLIEGGGGGGIKVYTTTVTTASEVRPLAVYIPPEIPVTGIMLSEAAASDEDIIAAKETSSTATLLQRILSVYLPGYTAQNLSGNGSYGASIRRGLYNGSFNWGIATPTAYGSQIYPDTRKMEFSGGVAAHRFAANVPYTITIYYKED